MILAGHEGDADGVELPCLLPVRSGKVVEVSRRGRGFRLYACFLPGRSCTEPIRLASVLQPPAPLRCVPCPSWPSGIEQAGLTVMASIDRKGVQVSGWCQTGEAGLPSRPSVIGGIQLTPGGTLLIHGPDGPTTGGYEMLGAVIRADWPLLGQLSPGDPVRVVSVDQAEALRAWEKSLAVQRHERLKAALLERLTAR